MSTRNDLKARLPLPLRNGFAYQRALYAAVPAKLALERARADSTPRYSDSAPRPIIYNAEHELNGEPRARWIENASRGLRRVGFADEIASAEGSRAIDHKGWFTDSNDQNSVMRGIVYQLPAARGRGADRERYVYGFAETSRWS